MALNDMLIGTIVGDLKPVRRTPAPIVLAAGWSTLLIGIAAILAAVYGFTAMSDRLTESLPSCASIAASALTAALASVAVFELGLPDRRPVWALLPVPAVILWIITSAAGCIDTHPTP